MNPSKDSIVVCRVCKIPPTCISHCDGRIYYIIDSSEVSRACIHLGRHNHPISKGQCRKSLNSISNLIAQEVEKTCTAKAFAIAMAASKEFLDTFLVHSGEEPKEMLKGSALDVVMDKVQLLSSPNIRSIVASF